MKQDQFKGLLTQKNGVSNYLCAINIKSINSFETTYSCYF